MSKVTFIRTSRTSVEKVYGWKEKDGMRPQNPVMLGLLEIWGECPEKGMAEIPYSALSAEGLLAVKKLWRAKNAGWIG